MIVNVGTDGQEYSVPAASKVRDLPEALEWLRDGRTYRWIVDEYVRRYGIRTTTSMWAVLRRRHDIPRRIVRNTALIPWAVAPQHRHGHAIAMLRAEARRRAGVPLSPKTAKDLGAWLGRLERDNTVVLYDRVVGWQYVPRRNGVDLDLIRGPKGHNLSSVQDNRSISSSVWIVYDDGRSVPLDPLLLESAREHPR